MCPEHYELVLFDYTYYPPKSHFHTFYFLGFTVLFVIPFSVLLYFLMCVPYGGCKCPSSISMFPIGSDSCESMYNPLHFSSADYFITYFITLSNMNIGPLKSSQLFCPNKYSQLPCFFIITLQGMQRHCWRLI